jgi:hypothetical protein
MKTDDILLVELLSGLHLALIATFLFLDFPVSNCWSKSKYGRMQPPYLHSRHWLTFAEILHESYDGKRPSSLSNGTIGR